MLYWEWGHNQLGLGALSTGDGCMINLGRWHDPL